MSNKRYPATLHRASQFYYAVSPDAAPPPGFIDVVSTKRIALKDFGCTCYRHYPCPVCEYHDASARMRLFRVSQRGTP